MKIRKVEEKDKSFISNMYDRFYSFDLPEWRGLSRMQAAQINILERAVEDSIALETTKTFVGEQNGEPLGFVTIKIVNDYFLGERQAYIESLAVVKKAEGLGVASKLLEIAQEWAVGNQCNRITLNVFKNNTRAIHFYEKKGFIVDFQSMVKEIGN